MKIVILDGYTENPGDIGWDAMEKLGELTVYDRTPAELVTERIGDAEIVLTNKTVITKENMDACPAMKYIGVLATGYNVVDIPASKERGITVTNIPAYSTPSVGQHTMALLLEICNMVGHHSEEVHKGRWCNSPDFCFWDRSLVELDGKTMGLIGCGSIGQRVALIAQAMGMKVLYNQRHRNPAIESETCVYAELDELLAKSDVVSMHCPQTEGNTGIICAETISKMKDGVIFINTARGGLVVEEDLAAALRSGKIYGAAVDVVSKEPMRKENALLDAPNCIITPHISWAPVESRQRLMDIAVGNVKAYQAGEAVNVVNR